MLFKTGSLLLSLNSAFLRKKAFSRKLLMKCWVRFFMTSVYSFLEFVISIATFKSSLKKQDAQFVNQTPI